jgi:hypothetical protein
MTDTTTDTTTDSFEKIWEEAREDPTLLSTIDVDSLLDKIEDIHFLANKTVKDLSKDIFDALSSIECCEDIENLCVRLSGYQCIDRLCDLRTGRLVRWIKKPNGKLTNGGVLVDVKIENKGVKLLCKNNMNRFFSIYFDDCLVFQKLTMEEQLILMASSQVDENICTGEDLETTPRGVLYSNL